MQGDPRIETLARRSRALDRYRRLIAVAIGGASITIGVVVLPRALGSEWPRFHARLMAVLAGVVLALVIDVGLAGLLAVWETRHARLLADRGLPRAELRRARRSARGDR